MKKRRLVFVLCLVFNILYSTESYNVGQLYHTLNLTCFDERDLKRICDSQVVCAYPSLIERTGDDCAVLYQLLVPGVTCDLTSRGLRYSYLKWWPDGNLISPIQLSNFVLGIKRSLKEHFAVKFVSENCFTTSDILQDQGLSAQKCFPSSSVGQVCSAIVDRLSRGESICDTEVVDDVSCVGDVVEQLFYRLADESGKLTLTQLQQLPDDHYRVVRQTEDHEDDDDDDENHDDDENDQDVDHKDDHDENDHHDHDRDVLMNCPTELQLMEEFNHVVEKLGLTRLTCDMEQHLNDSSDDHDYDHDNDFDDHDNATNCSTIYEVCHNLILEIGLTTEACLAGNDSSNTVSEDTHSDISDSEAYGYGFLSTVIISATSLLGVITIIFSYKSQASKYLLSILVAIGVSTLVSDAVLHLIPHAFGTHEEEEAGDGHDHSSKGEHNHDRTVIWRGCCVLAGIFIFYMFEFVMGIVKKRMEKPKQMDDSGKAIELNDSAKRGTLHKADTSSTSSHDECLNLDMDGHPAYFNRHQGFCHGITSVAWMVILGDGIHNFADGVAIGASFTSSLGVGVSTSLAVLFHELPHEFGDFAILLSSGMKWYVALMYNFLSAITAIIGMFVGVAIGNSEEDATPWILSITAGIFLYVALVDLLPALLEVLNNCKDRRSLIIYITCHLTGFFIGFAILLLIAIYEEDINNLVD